MTREELIGELEVWPATGRGDGLDAAVVSRLMKRAAEALRGIAQAPPSTIEDWSCAADFLDDIEVDAKGMCRWADVANAQTHIRCSLRSVQAALRNSAPQETRGDEPVAWRVPRGHKMYVGMVTADPKVRDVWLDAELEVETLYAAPQPSPRLEREAVEIAINKTLMDDFQTWLSKKQLIAIADAILALLSPDTTVVPSTRQAPPGFDNVEDLLVYLNDEPVPSKSLGEGK